ncbi:MAG: hypothetical protein M3N23_00155 [Pseudomonadota bacterium]|nr:hypothetical protein [Pseudomonadota bacterium]
MMMRESPIAFAAQNPHSVAPLSSLAQVLRQRSAPLLAMLLLHALLVGLWWQHVGAHRRDADNPSTTLTLIWAALPRVESARPATTLPRAATRSRPKTAPPERAPTPFVAPANPQPITSTSPPAQVDTVADPAPVSHRTLTLDALQQVGAIDRALRTQTPVRPSVSTHVSSQDAFGHAIASAGVHSALAPRMEQRIMPDGRAITRVTTGSGSYCVIQAGAGATDGIDHAQRGNSAKTADCGHLFD